MVRQGTENGVSPRFVMVLNGYFSDAGLARKIELELKKSFLEVPINKVPIRSRWSLLVSQEEELDFFSLTLF